jgi:hypothetical protein
MGEVRNTYGSSGGIPEAIWKTCGEGERIISALILRE